MAGPVFANGIGKADTGKVIDFVLKPLTSPSKSEKNLQYSELMQAENSTALSADLEKFINMEKENLKKLPIEKEKKDKYLDLLNKKLEISSGKTLPAPEKGEIKIPEKPSSFAIKSEEKEVTAVSNLLIEKKTDPELIKGTFEKLQLIQVAEAYADNYMPVIEDLGSDDLVRIDGQIEDLAAELEYNPVKIFNYVRNRIDYEPYFGVKKSSTDCLIEKVCNDVDTATLTIALMRASGIAARYKTSLIIMPPEQLKKLLGLETDATIHLALQNRSFTIPGSDLIALEWVHPEIFYQYDERKANFTSPIASGQLTDTGELRRKLRDQVDSQWIPVDTAVKSYIHTQKPILVDDNRFDADGFWAGYLSYQGELSPTEKYINDLRVQTGHSALSSQYLSSKTLEKKELDFLPYTTPYLVGEGEDANGDEISIEHFSVLPEQYKSQVRISLLDSDDDPVLDQTFYFYQLNNQPIELKYNGFAEVDRNLIVSNGGIQNTPAALVDIVPKLYANGEVYEGEVQISIGDSLTLQFQYLSDGQVILTDQKISVAGNFEGIFMYFSKLQENSRLDDMENPDHDSLVLLGGNAMIAREYLHEVEKNTNFVLQSLDASETKAVYRAVVTQNRILNPLDDTPTTFEFKGLSIDAGLYGNYYSNRGDSDLHGDMFSELWMLFASYYEGQVFTDLTGMDAISTVKGLQYAYSNPDQYNVHTITPENENEIDDLDLSDNTKANMRDDLAAGATIVTPDRLIQKGNWRGIIYVAHNPDGIDRYAIGEQAQTNGGATTEEFEVVTYTIPAAQLAAWDDWLPQGVIDWEDARELVIEVNQKTTINEDGEDVIISYQEGQIVDDIWCSITRTRHEEIVRQDGYEEYYGFPCYKPAPREDGSDRYYEFGDYKYLTLLTQNGAKFFRPNRFAYWKAKPEINGIVKEYIDAQKALPNNHITQLGSGFQEDDRFSIDLGVHQYNIIEKLGDVGSTHKYAIIYYLPTAAGGEAHRTRGGILNKTGQKFEAAKESDPLTDKFLGVPTGDEVVIDNSAYPFGPTVKQEFMNGVMFNSQYFGSAQVHYTYGEIYDEYRNNPDLLGRPFADPQNGAGSFIFQRFLNDKEVRWNTQTDQTETLSFRKYRCEVYGEVESELQLNFYALHGIFDSGVMTLDEVAEFAKLVWNIKEGIINANIYDYLLYGSKTIVAWQEFDLREAWNVVKQGANAQLQNIKMEWQESFGPGGCAARQYYLSGFFSGTILQAYFGELALKAATKFKIFNRVALVFDRLEKVEDIGKFGQKLRITNAADLAEWNRIKNLPQVEKGRAGEEFWRQFLPNNIERNDFEVGDINLGDRRPDFYDPQSGQAYEVKNYGSGNVSLYDIACSGINNPNGNLRDCQVLKDLWLMDNQDDYRPVWVFVDRGPSESLQAALEERAIEYIHLTN